VDKPKPAKGTKPDDDQPLILPENRTKGAGDWVEVRAFLKRMMSNESKQSETKA
jgi:hypothetical protein